MGARAPVPHSWQRQYMHEGIIRSVCSNKFAELRLIWKLYSV